jgi:hypothetical protein
MKRKPAVLGGDDRQRVTVRVARLAAEVLADAHDVLHQRGDVLEYDRIDPLQDIIGRRTSPRAHQERVVDVAGAVGGPGSERPRHGEMRRRLRQPDSRP